MAGIPTPEECRRLMVQKKLDPAVVAHVEAVAQLGTRVAKALEKRKQRLRVELVTAGCLLHDIGRAKTQGLDHALVGATMLRQRHYPESLCKCVERHTGGGLDLEDAIMLTLPPKDYSPVTLEEKLVCHIDNLFDGATRQPVAREIAWLRSRNLPKVADKIEKLHSEISSLLGMDLDQFE
ncbi:MAG TPA: HD domain-containing protein [Candidatus Thermoplasmatota archaeon]